MRVRIAIAVEVSTTEASRAFGAGGPEHDANRQRSAPSGKTHKCAMSSVGSVDLERRGKAGGQHMGRCSGRNAPWSTGEWDVQKQCKSRPGRHEKTGTPVAVQPSEHWSSRNRSAGSSQWGSVIQMDTRPRRSTSYGKDRRFDVDRPGSRGAGRGGTTKSSRTWVGKGRLRVSGGMSGHRRARPSPGSPERSATEVPKVEIVDDQPAALVRRESCPAVGNYSRIATGCQGGSLRRR